MGKSTFFWDTYGVCAFASSTFDDSETERIHKYAYLCVSENANKNIRRRKKAK